MDYVVEQNEIGEYVFCRSDECPKITQKELDDGAGYMPPPSHMPQPRYTNTYRVFFSLGSSRIGREAKTTINHALPTLKSAGTIYLRGWADSIGGKITPINKKLAIQRAQAIRMYLKTHGIKAKINTESAPPCCNKEDTRSVVITWS